MFKHTKSVFFITILVIINVIYEHALASLLPLSLSACLFTYALYVTRYSSLFFAYFARGQFLNFS